MTILSPATRIAYYSIPKVARTSVKTLFWDLDNGRQFGAPTIREMLKSPFRRWRRVRIVHDEVGYGAQSVKSARTPSDDYIGVTIVRDPLYGLRSASIDKNSSKTPFRRGNKIQKPKNCSLSMNRNPGKIFENDDYYRMYFCPADIHTQLFSYHIRANLDLRHRVLG